MATKNYFEILELSTTATEEEVKRAYKRQALKWHPDKNQDNDKELAEAKFRLIKEAYEYLCDSAKRVLLAKQQQKQQRQQASSSFRQSAAGGKSRWSNFQHPSTSSQQRTKEELERAYIENLRSKNTKLLDELNFKSEYDTKLKHQSQHRTSKSQKQSATIKTKTADLEEYEKMVLDKMRQAQAMRRV